MADIAELGLKVNTSDLEVGVTKLNALKQAAAGVGSESTKMAALVEGASATVSAAATASARAEVARAAAAVKAVQATADYTKEELAAAKAVQQRASAVLASIKAEETRVQAINAAAAANRAVAKAEQTASGAISQTQIETARAAQAAITAQAEFNTLMGVTNNVGKSAKASAAAFVELAQAEANAAQQAVKLASAKPMTSITSVTAQGRVGTAPTDRDARPNKFNTANIAAQFQDIGVTAAMGMNPLQIALQQGTQLSAILQTMKSPLQGLKEALGQVFNAISLGTIAIIAIVAALIEMVDWTDVAKTVLYALADVVEVATPYVVGFAAALALIYSPTIISFIGGLIIDIVAMGGAALSAGIQMAAAWVIGLGPVGWIAAGIIAVGALFEAMGFNVGVVAKSAGNALVDGFIGAYKAIIKLFSNFPDTMGDIMILTVNLMLSKIEDLINGSIDLINGLLAHIPKSLLPSDSNQITWKASIQMTNPYANAASNAASNAVNAFDAQQGQDHVGSAISTVKKAGKNLATGIRNYADTLGDDDDKKKDPWTELQNTAASRLATLKAEQNELTMTAEAADVLKEQTTLLNEARQKGIDLNSIDVATGLTKRQTLLDEGAAMGKLEAQTTELKNALAFTTDTAKGFFTDMETNLKNGEGVWASFANAAVSALGKIINKLQDAALDGLFGGSGLTGLSSGITGLAGLFGFGSSGAASSVGETAGSLLMAAKGGAFNNGVKMFANGGVVGSPTMFGMSSGMGMMGEAGPEAIMPLHRGPDGSLGVKLHGDAANDNSSSNGNNTYVINAPGASGAELEAVKQTLFALAGPGKIEARITNAQKRGSVS